eukprot:5140601-Prymnesium_polylepis.2
MLTNHGRGLCRTSSPACLAMQIYRTRSVHSCASCVTQLKDPFRRPDAGAVTQGSEHRLLDAKDANLTAKV